jgi:RHS repeat-associated protein
VPELGKDHDPLGRQSTVTTVVAKSEFTYDPATLAVDTEVISYNLDATPGYEFFRVLDRSRDALGRDTGFQLKTASTIVEAQAAYAYSPTDGRIAQISNPQISNQTFSYAYTPNSNLLATVTGPIHTVINQWEPTRDVLDTKTNKLAITVISKYDYAVNAIGQRTGVASGTAFPAVPSWLWSYDALGQVIAADSSVATSDRSYQYDTIGNRQKTANSLTLPAANNYTANALNQYTSFPSLASVPSYDFDGNMTSGPLPVSPTTNSTLLWDGENRLTEVKNAAGTTIEKNVFDSGSRKIATTANGVTTIYLYDGWNCIAEYSGTTLAKTRLWGTDLSGSMQGAGGIGGMLSESSPITSNLITFNSSYPTYDGNGNVSEYLDSTGQVIAHFEYDPFGITVVNTDTSNQFSYRFSTKPIAFATGFYYYGYRYYDPMTGRWPSRDPIEERGGLNLYGFVGNEPIWHIDILGLEGKKSCPFDVEGGHVGEVSDPREDRNNDGEPDEQDGCSSGRFYGASCYRTGRGSGYAWANEFSKRLSMEGKLFTGPIDPATGKPSESPYNNKAKKEDPTISQLLIEKIKQAEADAPKDCADAKKCCKTIELKVNCLKGDEMKTGRRTDSELEKACNYKNTYSCKNKRWGRMTYTGK